MKNRMLLIITLILIPAAKAGSFDDLINTVREYCPTVKELAVKKAIIEFNGKADCSGTFTNSILKDCSRLPCSQLSSIITSYISGRSGAVIGR